MTQLEALAAARLTGIMRGLQDVRLLPAERVWTRRIPDTPATDGEILARQIGVTLMADLIADDAKAVTYSQGKIQYETYRIPNLKFGVQMSQEMLNILRRLTVQGLPEDDGIFSNYQNNVTEGLIEGINQRKEAMLVAMLTDSLNYDRLGFKLSGVSWGMPSDLKVTPSPDWTDAANAKPLTDIRTLMRVARIRYGRIFNRITMSTQAFLYMVATTEFQNQMKIFALPSLFGAPALTIPLQSDARLRNIAERLLSEDASITIELYDARGWQQDVNGLISNAPYLQAGKVILTSSTDDGNRRAMDWASGMVTEALVAGMMPVNIVGRIPMGFGPVSYATAPPDLNPPNIVHWGVARGFPRKMNLTASAVLTVGTFVDQIASTVPFPS